MKCKEKYSELQCRYILEKGMGQKDLIPKHSTVEIPKT
jgi:hypothetical protein